MDALRSQIIERKVLDLVLKHAKFKDVPYKPEGTDTESRRLPRLAAKKEESEIPGSPSTRKNPKQLLARQRNSRQVVTLPGRSGG